jgi:uncharacterized protein YegP (UPF0339 family)
VFDKQLATFYLANQGNLRFNMIAKNQAVIRLKNLYGAKT